MHSKCVHQRSTGIIFRGKLHIPTVKIIFWHASCTNSPNIAARAWRQSSSSIIWTENLAPSKMHSLTQDTYTATVQALPPEVKLASSVERETRFSNSGSPSFIIASSAQLRNRPLVLLLLLGKLSTGLHSVCWLKIRSNRVLRECHACNHRVLFLLSFWPFKASSFFSPILPIARPFPSFCLNLHLFVILLSFFCSVLLFHSSPVYIRKFALSLFSALHVKP